MSFVSTKGIYHVAIDGVGLILQGAPDRMAYRQQQAPVYGQRFASGDRDYNDLSQWWYFVQTDWSGGFKDSVSWANDAKYYYSTNIDTWSEQGAIKLARNQVLDEDFNEDIICGAVVTIAGTNYQVVGGTDGSDSRPHIYRASQGQGNSWTDISTTTIGTNQNVISQLSSQSGILWVSTVGVGNTWVVITYDGTTWTDQSANINTGAGLTYSPASSRTHCHYQGTTYVFVDNSFNNQYALVKTTKTNPSAAGDWTKVFEMLNVDGLPVASCAVAGNIYYLVNGGTLGMELWVYNIAGATNTLLQSFPNTGSANWGVGDKLIVNLNGVLIISLPSNQIWTLNTSTGALVRIWFKDSDKANLDFNISTPVITNGCVISESKAHWGNAVYDGVNLHTGYRDFNDGTNSLYMLYVDAADRIWQTSSGDASKLYVSHPSNWSDYKGATDNKNYLIFSNFDNVAGVDKIAYSATILFKPLASGQSIEVEYLLGELTSGASWTSLGTASATIDGTTVRDKTFFFGTAVIFKKIWFRVKLEAGGSNTPTMNDLVMEYLPIPTYKKLWILRANCGDEVNRLDGQQVDKKGRELRGRLEVAWWTKAILDFQDFDYATTTVQNNPLAASDTTLTVPAGGTRDFPEQGRLKIEDEEIFYTGKTDTTFTGLTRGARGTRAVSHAQNTVVNNAYKVIITDLANDVPIALEGKQGMEYVTQLTIREA